MPHSFFPLELTIDVLQSSSAAVLCDSCCDICILQISAHWACVDEPVFIVHPVRLVACAAANGKHELGLRVGKGNLKALRI